MKSKYQVVHLKYTNFICQLNPQQSWENKEK
jgi:hypothetical protein